VTSAKPGNGVEALRDGKDDTYWQSDGAQPHLVNIQFQRKVQLLPKAAGTSCQTLQDGAARHVLVSKAVRCFSLVMTWRLLTCRIQVSLSAIALLLDFKLDESYTPSKIAIRAGTTHADLKEVWSWGNCDSDDVEPIWNEQVSGMHEIIACAGAPADADQSTGLVQYPAVSTQPAVSYIRRCNIDSLMHA
jgi:Anaphase-promoting complex, subunit 10 (APC10)